MGDITYANYFKRLKGEKVPTYDGDPDCGFYRKPIRTSRENGNKITGWEPVAYFMHLNNSIMVGMSGKRRLTSEQFVDYWTYVCAYPVPEDVWRDVVEKGLPWPRDLIGEPKQASRTAYPQGDINNLKQAMDECQLPADNPRAVAGNNNPPEEAALPPEAVLAEEIRNAIAANEIAEITTDEESAQVAATRNRLNEFKNKAAKEK